VKSKKNNKKRRWEVMGCDVMVVKGEGGEVDLCVVSVCVCVKSRSTTSGVVVMECV